jgi:alpha-maltose-1-phosphate synthase
MTPRDATVTRALFINSGILGQRTFASFVRSAFSGARDGVEVTQVLVTEDLTLEERIMRRVLCAPLWPSGAAGLKNLDLHRFRAELNAGLLARNRIRRLERAGATFDVLHFHRQATAYASLRRMRRVPSIVSCDTTQGWLRELARSNLEAATYLPNVRRDGEIFAAAKLIVSTSRWAARHIRAEYPECATEILVMPNPVPLPPGSERWAEERYARAAATPGYRPRVLFVGSDFPRKGGFDLLRVWETHRLHEHATLALTTGWPLDRSRLPPGVTLHPGVSAYTDAWRALWHEADMFVMPTCDDAWGNVFQEAAAAGLPAIGTRITAVPEIIEDEVTGLLVPPADADALAGAMNALMASPERRRELGTRARAFVARTADPEHYRATLAASIRRLAGH